MAAERDRHPGPLRFLALQASRLVFAIGAAIVCVVGFVILAFQRLATPPPSQSDPASDTFEVINRVQRSLLAIAGRELPSDNGFGIPTPGGNGRPAASHRVDQALDHANRASLLHPDAVFSGHCAAISVPDLLSFLQVHEKSGVLRVVSRDEIFTLEIDHGVLVHASSDNPPGHLLLGEILVARGYADRELIARYLQRLPEGMRLGEALELAGEIERRQLLEALQHQAQELCNRLCALDDARFSFVACGPPKRDGRLRLNINGLLIESARVRDEIS
jgi:hypothetical protein